MYYTNIGNKDLEPFHDLRIPNFSITLTDLLTSGLFKVETIITSKLYRIYPLFYTGTINSSNPDDKIIEDKCIIANKVSKETIFTFLSNPDEPVQDYVNYGSYYEINDSLTDAEFNSIISLLLRNTLFTDNISLNNGVVKGVYGEYDFDITSTTIIDTGILITRETLSNLGTVTLREPVFHNATYTLNLTVVHDTDINILEVDDDNTVTETLEVELVPDTAVNIPFDTLDYNYVILKEASVSINHDKPIIRGVQTNTIGVTATKNTLQQGGTSTLTFTAYDLSSLPSPNQSIDIYKDNAKITTLTTNQQGQVSYTYTATGTGEHTFKGVQDLVESNDYDLLDCLFYDGGVTGNTNNGFLYNTYVTVTIDDTGTTVTENSGVGGRRYSVLPPGEDEVYRWNTNLIIECDIVYGADDTRIGVREWWEYSSDDVYQTLNQLGLTNGGHLKITYDGTNVKYYVNDTLTYTSDAITLTDYGVTFLVPTNGSFKYKDFKIYPLGE